MLIWDQTKFNRKQTFTERKCSQCGGFKRARDGRRFLFQYTIEASKSFQFDDPELFCDDYCHRKFYNDSVQTWTINRRVVRK